MFFKTKAPKSAAPASTPTRSPITNTRYPLPSPLGKKWFVCYSINKNIEWSKHHRNVRITLPPQGEKLKYTYQNLEHDDEDPIHEKEVEDVEWSVVAQGKRDGLEARMIETANGIEDSSGDFRPDHRTKWALLLSKSTVDNSFISLDLLSSKDGLSFGVLKGADNIGLLEEVATCVKPMLDRDLDGWIAQMEVVWADHARDQQDIRDWEEFRRTDPNRGYQYVGWIDEKKEKKEKEGRCVVS